MTTLETMARANKFRLLRLGQHPTAAERIARWYFDEWGCENQDQTVTRIATKLRRSIGTEALPSTWIAIIDDLTIGAAQLKLREVPELYFFEYWLGGVYVDRIFRGRGVAQKLIEKCVDEAATRNIRQLYLQTEEHNVDLYARFGWRLAPLPSDMTYPRPVMVREIRELSSPRNRR